jgi:hypothetical protein
MTVRPICSRSSASLEQTASTIEDDMIGSARQVEYAFLRGGHAMKDAEKQLPLLSGLR